ncbi:MAG: hypothetical protein ABSD47_12185 [Candidatus Methylomirabilota bacterium]
MHTDYTTGEGLLQIREELDRTDRHAPALEKGEQRWLTTCLVATLRPN